MASYEGHIYCNHPGCSNSIRNTAWHVIKSGWFRQRDGKDWCTDHIPDWVEEWRARKQEPK